MIRKLLTLLIILSCFGPGVIPVASLYAADEETVIKETAELETEQDEPDSYNEEEEEEEASEPKPLLEGKFQVKQILQSINADSRINPENKTLDLQENRRTIHIYAQISDTLDEAGDLRWMFRTYGFSKYESTTEGGQDDDLLRIDELFVDWLFGEWFVNLGKRRITWGTTSAFNPVNVVVPPKNPLIPDPQTEGHPLFLVNFASDNYSFDLVLTRNYDRDWYGEYQRWGARLGLILGDADIGLYYFDGEEDENGFSYPRMVGASYSSNFLDDATLYLELVTFSENYRFYFDENGIPFFKNDPVTSGAIGSVITLDGNASILVELFHSGSGYSKEERDNYFKTADATLAVNQKQSLLSTAQKWVLAQYQTWLMNPDYLLLTYNKSFWEKYSTGISLIAASDGSAITTLNGSYSISDYYLFEASLRAYSGDEESEFGNYTISSDLTLSLSSSF